MPKPNILYLHSHDTGRYVQPYGHAAPTPNIQRLAEQGVQFRQCFCAAPSCSPSRAALPTGRWPHSAGINGLAHRGFPLPDNRHVLVPYLAEAGYHTALFGMTHIMKDKTAIGYHEIAPVNNHSARTVAPAAAEWLRQVPRQPFFLDVGFSETHRVFPDPGPTEDPRYCLPPPYFPDTAETRHDMAAFKASARVMDEGIGQVLRALDEVRLTEETLVINTTDHGIAFPRAKCNLTDHGIGVMLILRGAGGFTGGKVCDALVSHVDLFPTVCDLAGLPSPDWLQGKSLLPLLRSEAAEIHEEVFAEVSYHAAYEPMRAVRTKRWKYIRRFDGRTTPVLPNCDDGPTKDVWLRHGWREQRFATEQLYDLAFDPAETNNLAGEATCRGVLADLRAHRYHLGLGLQEMAVELVDRLIVAEYTKDRGPLLRQINLLLEQMRYRVPLCKDVGLLTVKQYEHASRQIDGVGTSVGAWGKR